MQVSRCRFWWCSKCKAVFEKEDLHNKVKQFANTPELSLEGTRTCGHCEASYQLKDVYSGRHDVPRQFWGQLQQPVEIPLNGRAGRSRRGRQLPTGSPTSVLTAWLLFLVSLGSAVCLLGYVLVKPFLSL